MSKMSSMGKLFERRGDPLVSGKEGLKSYGRTEATENPELDQFYYAKRAKLRIPFVDLKPAVRPATQIEMLQRQANSLMRQFNQQHGRLE